MADVWLTRDTLPNGDLMSFVCVWSIKPKRFLNISPGGAVWLHENGTIMGHEESIALEDCVESYGVKPDNDKECVRVGVG